MKKDNEGCILECNGAALLLARTITRGTRLLKLNLASKKELPWKISNKPCSLSIGS
jgi:hypothetical protein